MKIKYFINLIAAVGLFFPAYATANIHLEWDHDGQNLQGFGIERRTPGNDWVEIVNDLPSDIFSYTDNTAVPGTAYEYRAYAFNNAGNSDYSNQTSGIAKISYAYWQSTFASEVSDPSVLAEENDPDHDGVANIVEYALNTNPLDTASSQHPKLTFIEGNEHSLSFKFNRVPYANDINYVVMESSDLKNWNEIARIDDLGNFISLVEWITIFEETEQNTNFTTTDIQASIAEGGTRQFMKLVIEKP